MNPECEQAVTDYLGRDLKPSEAKAADDAVSLQMRLAARRDPQAWLQMSPQERLQAGAKAAAADIIGDLKLKQRRVALQIAAHDRIENAINQAISRLPPEKEHWWQFGRSKPGSQLRAVSELLAFDPAGHGITSVETTSHAIANEALGNLMPLWNSVKGFAHLFEDRQGVNDLVHELFGEDSGNAAAKAGAKAWIKVTDELRSRANAAGMDIGKLEDWHYPQNWSQSRVATAAGDPAASLEKFVGDMLPLLDRDKYLNPDGTRMTDSDLTKMLGNVFDTITSDGMNKTVAEFKRQTSKGTPTATYSGTGFGDIMANRQSAHRALFFKDADSYMSAQGLYGQGSLWPALTGHIRSIARDIGLVETLGPNPAASFKFFNDRTHLDELRQAPESANSINSAAKFNESLFDFVSGQRGAVNAKIEAVGQAFRNFESATKLGNVVLTALGDEAGMAATCFANRVPFSENLMRELAQFNPANSDARTAAAHSGVGINSMIGGLNRFGQEDMRTQGGEGSGAEAVRNFTGKLATGVLTASGAEGMWDIRRRALGSVLMSAMGNLTRKFENFKDMSFDDAGMLTRKGVTETDWQVWKNADLEDWGMKHGVLTPKAVWSIPDEKLAGMGDPTALKRHAASMLLGHVLEETGMGVMDTGARERASMMFGTTPGTVAGELTRSALLFKSFSMSMMMKHWARAASMPTGRSSAMYAATLVVTGTIMGALANQIRNLTQGKDPENMASPQFWGSAILRGGGLGFYGDFLYDELTSHDTSLIPALMGPLATSAEEVWNLTGAAAFKNAKGERTDEGANLVRFAKSNIPFQNMWYLRAAFEHLIWNNMQEAASPGYLDRMQAKAYAQRGSSWWWDPHDTTPQSAPDLSKAIQPDRGRQELDTIAQKTGME
ncbi:MAG TPA: hypothetical protein VGG49_13330 [Steroidobacteraceae bacterium]|jgi:hypothetical protein